MTDILATTPEKRNRHLKRIVTYRDIHYHGTVTDITKEPSLTVTDISPEQGGQIKNSKFRNFFLKIRKPSEIFFEKSERNQKEQFLQTSVYYVEMLASTARLDLC